MSLLRKTQAIINLDNIQHNYRATRADISPSVKIAGVVKANAYGHDIMTITGALLECGIDCIAVATLQEGVAVRRQYPGANILVMGYIADDQLRYAVEYKLTATIFSLAQAHILAEQAGAAGQRAPVHIKVETGLNRLGYWDHELALEEVTAMAQLTGIKVEGIFSHLALYNPEADKIQYDKLMALVAKLEGRGVNIPIRHICDSIGAAAYPEYHLDMVRLGGILYGYTSRKIDFAVKPVMTFRTEVSMVKTIGAGEGVSYSHRYVAEVKSRIATLPVGYADGLPRNVWEHGHVMINGQQAKYAGLPCMDQCMIDVTGLAAEVGDEVILFGGEGENELHLSNLSRWCDTNRNEVLSRISPRVCRIFTRGGCSVKVIQQP